MQSTWLHSGIFWLRLQFPFFLFRLLVARGCLSPVLTREDETFLLCIVQFFILFFRFRFYFDKCLIALFPSLCLSGSCWYSSV